MQWPNWRNQGVEHLPPFPEKHVRAMLAEFGIVPVPELEPWPHGPSDILARFEVGGEPHLLKGRHIEHRGERSLFETHRLQRLLLAEGLPVPSLLSAPSGETLVRGTDWEEEGAVLYYEIQRQCPGSHFTATADNLRRAGVLIAQFHEVGAAVDTFLLNKSTYIGVFRQRGFEARERLRNELLTGELSPAERQRIDRFFDGFRHPARDVYLDWRIVHGDLSVENLLVEAGRLFLVDWDEIGLGPKTSDHGDLLGSLDGADEAAIRALLGGYCQAGGQLSIHDLESIHDGIVLGALRRYAAEADVDSAGDVFDQYAFLLS